MIARIAGHVLAIAAIIVLWETAVLRGWIDGFFFGQPSGIWAYLVDGFVTRANLWLDLAYTVWGTVLAFGLGSVAALVFGMAFVMVPKLERALDPYMTVLNAMPRLALAPLFMLWFGLGLGSKVAVGTSLTFFIVLSSTVAGIRGATPEIVALSRSLGASPIQVFFKVTLPSAVPVIFSGLRLGLIYAMLGVVGAEIIAAQHGLGQRVAYLQSTFNINGVMALLVVLALLGTIVTQGMTWLERRLLHWQ